MLVNWNLRGDEMSIKHTFITKDGHETKELSPTKAIRKKCLECSCWSIDEVRECPAKDCALYPFRFGKDPGRKKVEMSDERRAELKEQLERGRKTQQESDPMRYPPTGVH
jgi:hypothetical protein